MREEQPLPPYGACLLGSFNLTKYVTPVGSFDEAGYADDIAVVVRAMDNIIDRTIYPLPQQEEEAKDKRRMGLGVTGLANAAEMLGYQYGSDEFMKFTSRVLETLRDEAYSTSADLAAEKGSFPLYQHDYYTVGNFFKTLPDWLQSKIKTLGIRNSHLTSIAPTGTISLTADNVSSGIEPPFSLYYDRTIQLFDGAKTERVEDYAYRYGVSGKTANEISAQDHLKVLALAQQYIDSACSKTCNVGDHVTFDEFKTLYYDAWKAGCKGITTFRQAGLRYGVLNEVKPEVANDNATEGAEACFIDPLTGQKECG